MVADLRDQARSVPGLKARLDEMYGTARAAKRTGEGPTAWLDDQCEQAASSWVVACAFIRFCEDNDLTGHRWIASRNAEGHATSEAADAEEAWIAANPRLNAREWLREAFRWLRSTRAGHALLPDTDFVWWWDISADRADALIDAFRRRDEDGVRLVHDFHSESLDTRFLGDLYQDLSVHVQEKYALLQTPVFVEEFILDQTLTPALERFDLAELKLIDPTCGSGHFLLGAFDRLLDEWLRLEPGTDPRVRVQHALDSVHGVDINPAATAITKFRLMVAALRACRATRLDALDTPELRLNVGTGDSLIYGGGASGGRQTEINVEGMLWGDKQDEDEAEKADPLAYHLYGWEDLDQFPCILDYGRYHVVVGNPPYIQVKDKALNQAYRDRYGYCHRKYALSVPFAELFFRLAVKDDSEPGYVGQITANSFMKREFGKKIIEEFFAIKVDLTHVIDTSGAYIPGHGTPTVILIGKNRDRNRPTTVRAVLGVRGEPAQPADPSRGKVWRSIVENVDLDQRELPCGTAYITVTDLDRARLSGHPWSLSGGGADTLKETIESARDLTLGSQILRIGFYGVMGTDDAMTAPARIFIREHVEGDFHQRLVLGDEVRDFDTKPGGHAFHPYDNTKSLVSLTDDAPLHARRLWPLRTELGNRATFSKRTYFAEGRPWYEWHQLPKDEGAHTWSIAFAEVATHNHFVLDRGGKVFKQTAPVIKLKAKATEDDHLRLLGLLNSSTACFWLKEVSQDKPSNGVKRGLESEKWTVRFQYGSTKVSEFPLPTDFPGERARLLDDLARELAYVTPTALCAGALPTRDALNSARDRYAEIRARMISVQEELDWEVYRLYGILEEDLTYDGDDLPGLTLGQRAFEIVLGRQVEAGETETAWFERHRSTMRTDLPAHWPEAYKELVRRRIDFISNKPLLHLVERPECKRRWAAEPYETARAAALRDWLLDRLEDPRLWSDRNGDPRALSVAQLADLVRLDEDFRQVLDLYVGTPDHDLTASLAALLKDEQVPFLAAYRYKESGLRKRAEWEQVWELQRQEDAWEAAHARHQERWLKEQIPIPETGPGSEAERPAPIRVPPKYGSADFLPGFWRHRGKLDVAKERFIGYPGAERDGDTSPVYGWAGWDHLQQATALANLVAERGLTGERVIPLLAGVAELEPWLHQWHNEYDAENGDVPAEYFSGWLRDRLAEHELTRQDLATWRPPASARGARSRKSAKNTQSTDEKGN